MLAPVIPQLTEELYKEFFGKFVCKKSIHLTSWPSVDEARVIDRAVKRGEFAKLVISAVRKYKHERGLSLNAELAGLQVFGKEEDTLLFGRELTADLMMTLKVKNFAVTEVKSAPDEAVQVTEDCFVKVEV